MVSFDFCFRSNNGEVVAAMMRWNKASPASLYLNDIQFDVNGGPATIGVARSVVLFGSWPLVCLSRDAVGLLLVRRLRPLHSSCSAAMSSFYDPLDWW